MSDNPFASSSAPSGIVPNSPELPAIASPAPGALTVICIFCLILGLLGFLGSCLGVVALAFQSMIMDFAMENSPNSPEMKFQEMSLAAQSGFKIPQIIMMGANLIIGAMLFIGSIGCLRRKENSRSILRMGLLGAIVYSILKIIFSIFVGLATPGALRSELEKLPNDADFQEIEPMVEMAATFSMIGIVFASLISLVLAGFYLWSRGYLNRPDIVKHFSQ